MSAFVLEACVDGHAHTELKKIRESNRQARFSRMADEVVTAKGRGRTGQAKVRALTSVAPSVQIPSVCDGRAGGCYFQLRPSSSSEPPQASTPAPFHAFAPPPFLTLDRHLADIWHLCDLLPFALFQSAESGSDLWLLPSS